MGKSVSDVASLLDVLTSMPTTFLQDMGTGPCPRIGLLTQRASIATSEEDELFEKAIDALGHNVDRSLVHIPSLGQIMDAETFETMWSGHSKEAWRKYLGLTDGSIRTLAQLVAWHDSHPVRGPVSSMTDKLRTSPFTQLSTARSTWSMD